YDLNYASLMAVLFGLSVIIPYLGAVIVTAMAIAIAVFQWGFVDTTYIFSTLVLILQLLDGYVLVPLLFSRAVNLHPVAVILSIVFFGGIWGVWGVVLSIPLGTFIKVLIDVWPNPLYESDGNTEMGAAAGVDPTPAGSHYDGPEDSKK
ncbi:MAG: AI-2E family transporter, partial [Candidatus Porifericomitaceae bacterium WSBS_2022_MAG_OTU9]